MKLRLVAYLNYVVREKDFQNMTLKVSKDGNDVYYVSKKKMKEFKKKVLENIYVDFLSGMWIDLGRYDVFCNFNLSPSAKHVRSRYFVFQSVSNPNKFWQIKNQDDVRFGYELESVEAN